MNHLLGICITVSFLGVFEIRMTDAEDTRILFHSSRDMEPDLPAKLKWQSVNDGVMGGLSEGSVKVNKDNQLVFHGTLSLENNGGFASIRSLPTELNLKKNETIFLRVKGDGRKYFFNLHVPSPQIAFSYRSEFETRKDEWIEIKLPLDQFYATSFGRKVNVKLDASKVHTVGFLLADKKTGVFQLQVDWIKVIKSE